MANIPDWLIWLIGFIGFSGCLGLASFLWRIWDAHIKKRDKPELSIDFQSIWNGRWVVLNPLRKVKFHCLIIRNLGKITAKRCVGQMKITNKPDSASNLDEEHALHWSDIEYSYRTNEPQPIDIGSEPRRLDVLFSQASNPAVLPAGINISSIFCSGGANTIEPENGGEASSANSSPISPPTSLDSWVAVPIALSNPSSANQAKLPPGNYFVIVRVDCENGVGDEKIFRLHITSNGLNNSLNEVI